MTITDQLDQVILGKENSIDLPRFPINKAIQHMRDLGYKVNQDINGYCVDFWIYFTKEGAPSFTLSGDLWYADTYTFYSNEGV